MKKTNGYLHIKNELFLLYLKGLRGSFENTEKKRPYFFYPKIIIFGSTILLYISLKENLKFVLTEG